MRVANTRKLNESLFSSRKDKKSWDVFRESSSDNFSSSELHLWDTATKVTKVIASLFIFIFVLATAVISKLTLILMTSNMFPPENHFNSSAKTAYGLLSYKATETNIMWVWSIMIVMGTPYVFTFIKCAKRLCFKKTKRLDKTTLCIVSVLFLFIMMHNIHCITIVYLLCKEFGNNLYNYSVFVLSGKIIKYIYFT